MVVAIYTHHVLFADKTSSTSMASSISAGVKTLNRLSIRARFGYVPLIIDELVAVNMYVFNRKGEKDEGERRNDDRKGCVVSGQACCVGVVDTVWFTGSSGVIMCCCGHVPPSVDLGSVARMSG